MEDCVVMAKEFMKRSGLSDLRLAKKAIKALVGFARAGAEIGVAGEMFKPDLDHCLAIQRGLNKMIADQKEPRKLFVPSWNDPKRKEWEALPGEERLQCARCLHVVAPGERLKHKNNGVIETSLCPRCLWHSFYFFKYEVKK